MVGRRCGAQGRVEGLEIVNRNGGADELAVAHSDKRVGLGIGIPSRGQPSTAMFKDGGSVVMIEEVGSGARVMGHAVLIFLLA